MPDIEILNLGMSKNMNKIRDLFKVKLLTIREKEKDRSSKGMVALVNCYN